MREPATRAIPFDPHVPATGSAHESILIPFARRTDT